MNSYPQFLLNDPRPLVFLTGNVEDEPDLHARLIVILGLGLESGLEVGLVLSLGLDGL
jgi:hypothetical protein